MDQNQPTRQWFRLASQAIREPPQPAPAPAPQPVTAAPQPRRGPPIRQGSIFARSNFVLETPTPAPEPTQAQITLPPPPPPPRVPTPPPPAAVAPPPPPAAAPPRVPSPPVAVAPPKAPTPPPAIADPTTITNPTTITIPRTLTLPTSVTLPRTITPPPEAAPPKTQTPPPATETPERKYYRELTPPKPVTPPPPTVAIQPQLARPPSKRNDNGNGLTAPQPLVTSQVLPTPVPTRAPTPPESPKVIKTSPTPPQSPRIKLQQSATNMRPSSEPEPIKLFASQPKSIGMQDNSDRNYDPKTSADRQGELQKFVIQQADTRNAPPPSPKKEEKHAATANGKAFVTRKDEKEMRIITIAGENHGAIMDLGSGHQLHGRKHHVHHAKGHDGESSNDDGKTSKMSNALSKTKPMISLTNSNVQCVNNSILFNASSVNRNPGVHINFTRRHQPKNTTISTPQGGHPTLL